MKRLVSFKKGQAGNGEVIHVKLDVNNYDSSKEKLSNTLIKDVLKSSLNEKRKRMLPFFVRTNDDIVWLAVSRIKNSLLTIPKNYKINDGKSSKIVKGSGYYNWFESTPSILEKYLRYEKGLGEKVFLVDEGKVIEYYDPVDFSINIQKGIANDNQLRQAQYLINYISEQFDIEPNSIGIEGSTLLGNYTDNSDIDLLVYGFENARLLKNKLSVFRKLNKTNLFSIKEKEREKAKILEKCKDLGYGNNDASIFTQFIRRFYGVIENKSFSIIGVPYENGEGYINLNRTLTYIKDFSGVVKIISNKYSCIVPSSYSVEDELGNKYKVEIFNHYGINQAEENERFFIRGKCYSSDIENEGEIIILSFWSKLKERFDLL